MLKNKMFGRKIRNIVILIMVMIIVFGTYRYIRNSRAENVIEIYAIALDKYGYLEKEEFMLEAKQINDDSYEIELPESVNSKKINQIVKITLEDVIPEIMSQNADKENAMTENTSETEMEGITVEPESYTAIEESAMPEEITSPEENTEAVTGETTTSEENTETVAEENVVPEENTETELDQTSEESSQSQEIETTLEIVDNKIYLTKEQMDNKVINIEVEYDIVKLTTNEFGELEKESLLEKTEEEREQLEITEETEVLYSKILKYEDEKHNKLVEVKGYLPIDAKLQVEEVSEEKLKEIFGEEEIDVAYDIKIIREITKEVLIDEEEPEKGTTEITEIIEIDPEEFEEICEVSIKDRNIQKESQVYHVNEVNNTYEQVNVTENEEESISFEAQSFSIYAVSTNPTIMELASASSITMISVSSTTTKPYLPSGYSQVSGTSLSTGLVIEKSGNQYVWIEVPISSSTYKTAGTSITSFTSDELDAIEADIKTYTSTYRSEGTGYNDVYSSQSAIGLTETEYNNLRAEMLKSVYTYGGFYVGRYETGSTTARTSSSGSTTAVIKQNAYPYNYITCSAAQAKAESFASTGVTTGLMFGMQFDMILKYLENKGVSQSLLKTDSTDWGNYQNSGWNIQNEDGAMCSEGTWEEAIEYEKVRDTQEPVLLTTGASDTFAKQNIYDLAGNVREWTLEAATNYLDSSPCVRRSGSYETNGDERYAKYHSYLETTTTGPATGFRVGLFANVVDDTAPTVTITPNTTGPTNATSITLTFEFSEEPVGFIASDVTLTKGTGLTTATAGTLSGSGTTYTMPVTVSGTGKLTVNIAAGKFTDAAGNNNTASNSVSIEIDQTAPVWADSISDGTYSASAKTYTLNLTGSDETGLNTSSSSLSSSNMSVKVNGSSASFSVGTSTTTTTSEKFPLTIKNLPTSETITITITINAGALKDNAGNTSVAKTYEFTIDPTPPTVTITADKSSPTNASSITYTFTFSESVTGFSASGITVTNGTIASVTGSGTTWKAVVSNTGSCTQTIKVNAGACQDSAGNNNTASDTFTMVIDRTVPVWNDSISNGTYSASEKTYTLNLIGSDETGLNNSSSTLSSSNVTVKIDGTTVSSSNLTFGTATLNDKTKTFPLTIKNFTGGTVSIAISAGALVDTAGNTSAAKTYSFTIDGTAPVWADEVSSISYNSSTKAYSFNIVGSDETSLNNTSSELTASKMSITVNGTSVTPTVTTKSTTTSSETYQVTLSNFTGGTVKITINAGVLVDTAGNTSVAKSYEFTADVTSPVWGTATGTYNPDDQSYTITVSGSDETKLNNTTSNLTTSNTTLTVGGTTVTPTITTTSTTTTTENYQITWSSHSGGAISFTINAGALVDASSNTSASKTYTFDAVDATKPTWNDSISGGSYNSSTGEYTLSFVGSDNTALNNSSSVLSSSNVTITAGGSTVSSSDLVFGTTTLSGDGKTKTFPLTIKNFAGGQVNITISSGGLIDTTGNKSNSKSYSFFLDITKPVWNESISNGLYDPDTKTYTFDIIGTDETALNSSSTLSSYMSMTIGGTAASNYSIGTATTSADNKTKTFPVSITNYTGGEIVISVSAGALVDTAGNTSVAYNPLYTFTPDITAPVWTYQNVTYDPDARTYSLELVGTDETQLNTTLSTLITSGDSQNVTVTAGGTAITPTVTKLSTTSTQVVYQLVMENYPGGAVVININKGALIDTSSNKSIATTVNLDAKDITKPTWYSQNANYSATDGTYTFQLVATDNDKLDSSTTLVASGDNQNITVKCGATTVTPTITRTISDSQIVYTVTIADYPSGIVYVDLVAGAAVDVTGNKSDAKSFELPAEDIANPVWQENPTITYDYDTRDLVIQLVGTDETALNDSKTVLTLLSNIMVNVGGTTLDASRVNLVNGTLSADKMSKTFTITVNNFTGGNIEISLSAGALEDESGKISEAKTFSFDDVIRPIWSMEGDGEYNKSEGSYTLTFKGQDDSSLKTASLTTSNSTVTVGGTAVTPTITLVSDESNYKTYAVKISSYTGGTISVSINAGTLVDNADNQNIAATFSVTPDIVSPTWTAQNAGYTYETDGEVSVELIGSDDVQLLQSTLELSAITVTDGGTEIDSSNLSLSTATSTGDGKGGVKYVLTISGYSGGDLNIVIPEGTLEDPSGNVNNATTLSLGVIAPPDDDVAPVVTVVSTGIDKGAEAIVIVFDVTDDYFDYNETVTSDEFTIQKVTSMRTL